MEYRYWTKEEEDYLTENYGKIPVVKIAKYLNRDVKSVRAKAVQLEITTKGKCKRWELINKILNAVRKAKGLPLVPASENPYKQNL